MMMRFTASSLVSFISSFLGAVDLINHALKAHTKSKELRDIVGPIIGLLIPGSELENLAAKNVRQINEALEVGFVSN